MSGPGGSGGAAQTDPLSGRDDLVAAFQLEDKPVRGRIARLNRSIDEILTNHDYPAPVAGLLGEAVLLAVLVGSSLKFDGKLIVQAQGDGPVPLLLADYTTGGGVRGFARANADAVAAVADSRSGVDARALLGSGNLALSIDRGPDFDIYQSIAPIEGAHLSSIAEGYFEQSEQVPTRIALSVANFGPDEGGWRAGGVILQRIAADSVRGDTEEAWAEGRALFETVEPAELVDPHLSAGGVLLRLFHEPGVRVFPAEDVVHQCTCSYERVRRTLASFPRAELEELAELDGCLVVNCEYCNRQYRLTPDEVRGGS